MSRRVKILRELAGCVPIILGMLVGLLACLAITLLSGCKTRYVTQEVPVIVEHTTTNNNTNVVRDTLLMRDSVYHYVMGDTVRIERFNTVYKTKYDTLKLTATEVREVPVEVRVPVEVEKKLTKWEQFKSIRPKSTGLRGC